MNKDLFGMSNSQADISDRNPKEKKLVAGLDQSPLLYARPNSKKKWNVLRSTNRSQYGWVDRIN